MIEKDDLEYEGSESPETEYIVDPINETKQSIVYGLYSQLNSLSNFYSRIQNHYKTVAGTWLVAALAGIGYIFSQKESKLPIPSIYIAIFVLLAAIWGITLLWFLDIVIYHTFFYGIVLEELKLEKENDWLPKINKHLAKLQTNPKKRLNQSYFYIGCNYIFLIIMCAFFINIYNYKLFSSILILIIFIILGITLTYLFLRVEHPKSLSPVRKSLQKIL